MKHEARKIFPWYGWIGLILVALFWYFNWALDGLRTSWGFFPLWLGYILSINGFIHWRKGNSQVTRNFTAFLALFLISSPFWWLFELIDLRTDYWVYLGREQYTDFEYFVLATISFSTVLPAVMATSELVGSFRFINWFNNLIKVSNSNLVASIFFILGSIMLIALLIWPQYFPAFMWMSLYFITEAINVWMGNKNLLQYTKNKNWSPIFALWIGCLICGFFWEMWNIHSYPKWIYQVPFVDFWYLFEMPALGYLGYLPFALELYAMYMLLINLVGKKKWENYISLVSG